MYPAINDALRIVTGCLRPTLADNRPILAGIQPSELCHNGATLSLARRAMEPGHSLHSAVTCPPRANARRLTSRHPFIPAAQQLISLSDNNIRAAQWADHQWNAGWAENPTRLHIFIHDTGTHPPESPSQEEPRSGLTATTLVSGVSAPVCTNGVWPPLRFVGRRTNRRPCCPPMSNPSISSWTARPDGFG